MLRATETGSAFAMATMFGLALASTRCWGEPFSAAPPVGGVGGSSSGVGGDLNVQAAVTAGGNLATTATTLTATATGTATTGAAGGTQVSESPYGDNCQQLRLPAVADTYISGMFPDDNYDFSPLRDDRLEVSQYGNASKRTLLKFNVYFSTAEEWQIVAAFLEMQLVAADSYGTVEIHQVQSRAWEERYATWRQFTVGMPWTTLGGDYMPDVIASQPVNPSLVGQKIVWDVTTEAQRLHDTPEDSGWLLKEAGEPEQGLGLNFGFAGRDTMRQDEEGPVLAIHFCK